MASTGDLMQAYNKNHQQRLAKFYAKLQAKS
ncbi:MAG: hypothetical protein JWN82_92 [Candidatus Saccharibacteria bacterium]|nr:hypothetical protein [Candidatus Saccharibacteria bacterium]